jgi:beta-galactosidase
VIVAKTGSEVQQDNRNGYSDRFSQQAQARFFIQRFDILRTLDYDGGFVWAFNDWAGDRPALTVNSGDPWLHSMGIVSGAREKRLAYDAVRSIFHAERFVALPAGTATTGAPIIYVLAGFVILVALAYLYNANRRFRESVNRSLMNSYNFFSDVRDQHVVSVLHSTVLGLIVCVAMAIVASSILVHFRDSLFLDNLLSFLLVSDRLKVVVVHLIWNPLRFILVISSALFLFLLLVTGIVLALKALLKTQVYGFHAYTITMWSSAPFVILIPVGMILYRVMESDVYVIPALLLIVVLAVWSFIRFLKGISIIFDIRPVRVYLVGVGLTVLLAGTVYLYYDLAHSAPMYLSYMYDMLVSAR